MVPDRLTNHVYFSEWTLKDFPSVMNKICSVLTKYGVKFDFLPHTKDYWCRDYMPIQVTDNKFVQYLYQPDYLSVKNQKKYITDPEPILRNLSLETTKTKLIIDGGNIIKCPDKVIMTEKVFVENRHIQRNKLISELEKLFECDIVFLPWDKSEIYGHADGIVRWVRDKTVLLTAYEQSKYFTHKFRKVLEQYFDVIPMCYHTRPRNRQLTWAYINFLQTENVILVPAFNIREDAQALIQIEKAFPDYQNRVEPIDCSEIVPLGGALNCISWNIKRE